MMTLSGLDSVILLILCNRRVTWNRKITHSKVFGVTHKIMVTHTVTGTMSLTLTGEPPMRVGIDLIHASENMERNYGESGNVSQNILSYKH
jgi:hypothetical protein